MSARAWLRSPWLPIVLAPVALALAVAEAPLVVTLAVISAATASALVWKFGLREGLWYLLLATIPLREPLSIDVVGTVSIFPTDILLFVLFAVGMAREGVRTTWRESTSFKLGVAVLGLSIPGMLTAARPLWGFVAILHAAANLAFLFLALSMVRSGRDAQRVLVVLVLGMIPAVVYGLYQASLPYGAALPDWGSHHAAWDALGRKTVRVVSTFRHPIFFSHYMSIGLGISLGLSLSSLRRGTRWFLLLVGAAGVLCGFFSGTVGGLVGALAAVIATIIVGRRRRVFRLAPLALVGLIWFAPPALTTKVARMAAGQSTSAAARIVTYEQALSVIRDNPLLGVGWGSAVRAFEYDYRTTRSAAVGLVAENYFLHRGVALGLPGMAVFVVLCFLFFRNAILPRREIPHPDWPRAAILIGGVALYAHAQTFVAAEPTATYVLWILFGLAERMRKSLPQTKGAA